MSALWARCVVAGVLVLSAAASAESAAPPTRWVDSFGDPLLGPQRGDEGVLGRAEEGVGLEGVLGVGGGDEVGHGVVPVTAARVRRGAVERGGVGSGEGERGKRKRRDLTEGGEAGVIE